MSLKWIAPARFARFVSANALGTVVDTLVLWGLSRLVFATYLGRYVIAPTISFEAAVLNNFLLSYFWIWKGRVEHTADDVLARFIAYNLNALMVFFLKLALLNAVALLTGFDVVICNLTALMFTGVLNFLLQDRLIFRPKFFQRIR